VDEQLVGVKPTSQYGWALGELGVELIPAHSPQAKGRVERLFKTVQDRTGQGALAGRGLDLGGGKSVSGERSADLQPARCGAARAGRSSASPSSGTPGAGQHPVPQDDPLPAQGLHDCVSGRLYQIHETVRVPHVLVESTWTERCGSRTRDRRSAFTR
jgi:hypothetical protein